MLFYPDDLAEWQAWQNKVSLFRRIKRLLPGKSPQAATPVLYVRGNNPAILVALESATPSNVAANLSFLSHSELSAAVIAPGELDLGPEWVKGESTQELTPRAVIASGNYLPMGAFAEELAHRCNARFVVVQHGLMTPYAPPLPRDAHLLAFSDEDAAFWASGRGDITHSVVGSKLIYAASQKPRVELADADTPYFLGQLHGAELPRRALAATTEAFWRATDATYRPHPSEIDKLSRLQHALWERKGMRIDKRRIGLQELAAPVVGVFSTGIVEAAALGLPSWSVYAGKAPDWVENFWERYGIARYDLESKAPLSQRPATPAPQAPEVDPSLAIARAIAELA
ncbi:RNA-binding protein [Dermabacteraceae bacterium P13115]|nr:RNA-binding protein [Dermabacteraceae bacterium TAE3-ERU5]